MPLNLAQTTQQASAALILSTIIGQLKTYVSSLTFNTVPSLEDILMQIDAIKDPEITRDSIMTSLNNNDELGDQILTHLIGNTDENKEISEKLTRVGLVLLSQRTLQEPLDFNTFKKYHKFCHHQLHQLGSDLSHFAKPLQDYAGYFNWAKKQLFSMLITPDGELNGKILDGFYSEDDVFNIGNNYVKNAFENINQCQENKRVLYVKILLHWFDKKISDYIKGLYPEWLHETLTLVSSKFIHLLFNEALERNWENADAKNLFQREILERVFLAPEKNLLSFIQDNDGKALNSFFGTLKEERPRDKLMLLIRCNVYRPYFDDLIERFVLEGAPLDLAVLAYAKYHQVDKVETLLKQGASPYWAILGYGLAKNPDAQNALIQKQKNKTEALNWAVESHAATGEKQAVAKLLGEGAALEFAYRGLGMGFGTMSHRNTLSFNVMLRIPKFYNIWILLVSRKGYDNFVERCNETYSASQSGYFFWNTGYDFSYNFSYIFSDDFRGEFKRYPSKYSKEFINHCFLEYTLYADDDLKEYIRARFSSSISAINHCIGEGNSEVATNIRKELREELFSRSDALGAYGKVYESFEKLLVKQQLSADEKDQLEWLGRIVKFDGKALPKASEKKPGFFSTEILKVMYSLRAEHVEQWHTVHKADLKSLYKRLERHFEYSDEETAGNIALLENDWEILENSATVATSSDAATKHPLMTLLPKMMMLMSKQQDQTGKVDDAGIKQEDRRATNSAPAM